MIDLHAGWRPQVCASDASEFGLGAGHRNLCVEQVAELGRVSERARYRFEGAEKARRDARRESRSFEELGSV
eukprot:7378005-Pyramimonas_sp.AAC.1